ncbi:MAG TPA: hypothetical protein VN684_06330, partial [Terriglobales bacterium]|nr:hypothetical protein [Terriglobales bacterium]
MNAPIFFITKVSYALAHANIHEVLCVIEIAVCPPPDTEAFILGVHASGNRALPARLSARLRSVFLSKAAQRGVAPLVLALVGCFLLAVLSGCGVAVPVNASSGSGNLVLSTDAVAFGSVPDG